MKTFNKNLNSEISFNETNVAIIKIDISSLEKNTKIVAAKIKLTPSGLNSLMTNDYSVNFLKDDLTTIWTNIDALELTNLTPFTLNITDEVQHGLDQNYNYILIELSPIGSGSAFSLSQNELKVNYLFRSEYLKNSVSYDVQGGAINLLSGKLNLTHPICNLTTGALSLETTLNYNTGYEALRQKFNLPKPYGKNWKLNLEQYLIKFPNEDNNLGSSDFVHIDQNGNSNTLFEKYYYKNSNNEKVYLEDKSLISMDYNGNLKYDTYPIYCETESNLGLKLVTSKDDITGSENVELESNELTEVKSNLKAMELTKKQLETTITQTKLQLCLYALNEKHIKDGTFSISSQEEFEDLINYYYGEGGQFNEENTIYKITTSEEDTSLPKILYPCHELLNSLKGEDALIQASKFDTYSTRTQIHSCIKNLTDSIGQLEYYTNQIAILQNKEKEYTASTPIYFLYNDNTIYGFSFYKSIPNSADPTNENLFTNIYALTYIADFYNNYSYITYDSATNQILSLANKNEQAVTLNYKYVKVLGSDGINFTPELLLSEVMDNTGSRTSISYNAYKCITSINKIEQELSHRYIYDGNQNIIAIIDNSGLGSLLEYTGNKITTIKPISVLNSNASGIAISNGYHKLNNITENNITNYVLDNTKTTIDYYDYKSTTLTTYNQDETIISSTTYIFDKLGNTKTVYENKLDESSFTPADIKVSSFDYKEDKIAYSASANTCSPNYLNDACFGENTLEVSSAYNAGETVALGEDNNCTYSVYHNHAGFYTSLSATEIVKTVSVSYDNLVRIYNNKSNHLILSGWAKADSAFTPNPDEEDILAYEARLQNRKFELSCTVTYKDNTTETFTRCFDWMNTDWQYLAVPITLDLSKTAYQIDCTINYSHNTGDISYTDLFLRDATSTVNTYTNGLLTQSTTSDSIFKKVYVYDEYTNKLTQVKYYNRTLPDNEQIPLMDKYLYNSNGTLYKVISSSGIVTEKVIDNNGVVTKNLTYHISSPAEIIFSEQKTDENGTTLAEYNELGEETTTYEYDEKSNAITTEIDSDGNKTSFGYDLAGNLAETTTTINGEQNKTLYEYTLGFLTNLSHNNFDISYDYDNMGRLVKIRLAGKEYITYSYPTNTTTITTLPNGVRYKTTQDNQGNTIKVEKITVNEIGENVHSLVTENTYENGLLKTTYDAKTNQTTYYSYDRFGNQQKVHNNEVCLESQYSNENELETETTTITNGSTKKTLEYKFSYSGSLERNLAKTTLPNGLEEEIALDSLGRTKQITFGKVKPTSNEVLISNRVKHIKQLSYLTKGNHTSNLVSAEWFGTKVIDDVNNTYSDCITENLKYSYDAKGNITEIRENGTLIARYCYDGLSRLTREDNKTLNTTTLLTYDQGGNILTKTQYTFSLKPEEDLGYGIVTTYAYPATGWKDQLLSYNGEMCTYDEFGNPTKYRDKELVWDNRNLVTYNKANPINFTYNASGIRTSKKFISNGAEQTVKYYLSGSRILGEHNNYINNSIYYLYSSTGIMGMEYNGTTYTFKKNILGDVIGIYNPNNELIVKYVYDAWGNHNIMVKDSTSFVDISSSTNYTNTSIANANPFRFRGYYYDGETKLYYLNTRYYDPQTGRFINADDITILDVSKEISTGVNLFSYCFNNPINDRDDNGNISFLLTILLTSLIVGIANTALQATSDLTNYAITKTLDLDWENYIGAFVGGVIGGTVMVLTNFNLGLSFATIGGIETLLSSLLTNATGKTSESITKIALKTIISSGIGYFVGSKGKITKLNTFTIGKNSFLSVFKSGVTKLVNKTASKMSIKVIAKGIVAMYLLRSTSSINAGIFASFKELFE